MGGLDQSLERTGRARTARRCRAAVGAPDVATRLIARSARAGSVAYCTELNAVTASKESSAYGSTSTRLWASWRASPAPQPTSSSRVPVVTPIASNAAS
jgi:hypothetical protein